jgi:hypothetical protein
MTSETTRNVISSLAAGCGPSQPEWPDGQTTDLFGPVAAPASRSARQAKVEEPMIQGICGRTFIASSVPAGPLSSWESRLRDRLGMVGSTESALIWREKTTPAGASISRLAPSTRHTNGTGSIGSPWSTPRASDGEKGGPNMSFGAGGQPLPAQMHQAIMGAGTAAIGPAPTGSPATTAKRGAPNPVFAFWLMGFPDEWTSGAWEAMQLFRLKPQKSSRRSSRPRRELTLEEMLS